MTDALAKRPRVLVIDDNAALAENLAEILEEAGYETRRAGTGAEALAAARGGFSVALVDLRLPDLDGTELAARLKAGAPDSEIVLLTGFATVETAASAVRAGAYAYLVKPCATPELLLTIEQALRQVRLHSDKRELSRRAHVAERLAAVGTLTAGLSHEIRNPLNAAGLQLQVLERRIEKLPPELRPGLSAPLGLVRDEIRRLDHLLEDFLQFARPREMVTRPLNLAQLLASVLDLLQAEAERRGVTLERDFDGAGALVANDDRLRQVLMNLALNALDATPRGGRIRLSARDDRDDVVVAIEDSGPGVPEAMRERIFEPFFTTKAAGSGLGLSIVHAIVAQHGGAIEVTDSALGGARFAVRLPRA